MGHDVKLGRGGIREIEFIAQAHQLISGGRDVRLRNRATCQVLQVLADTGHIVRDTADELITAYKFLRTLEHRIQMVNDEQKHVLPSSLPEVTHIAGFMGYADVEVFSAELLIHLRTVQRHYERVFEHNAPQDGGPIANIATDNDLDPKAIKTVEELGFKFPDQALTTIQSWSHAPYRAMRYERARALLSELVGPLLAAASKTADPDAALRNFDGFLGLLPEGVQLFSLLRANPWLLNLLAEIMGSAPRLAALLGRNTGLLDGMLDTEFLSPLPSPAELSVDLELKLEQAQDYQDILDMSRTWANDHRFRVGIQVLRNTVSPNQASRSQSDLADVAIQILLPKVTAEFARQHGTFPGSEMCVLGLGKLGGREMTFTSDLDLVFIYNVDEDGQSDGPKPLFPSTYFARLSQRFINALAAPTGEGRLYEVDMRLRPSGRAGPIAQTTAGFAKYQHENAWTWEHMALTRARVITAGPQLKGEVESIIQSVLTASRLPGPLVADMAAMRAKMRQEFGTENIWMVKHAQGGMLDVEFIAQYLQLKYAAENPGILSANTGDCLDRLSDAGLLDPDQSQLLCSAFALYTGVQSLIRLCTEDSFNENNVPAGLQKALSDVGQTTDFESLKRLLQDTEAKVYRCFENLIVQSAACQPSAEGIQKQV
jgi:glutamate-ammonia-ligase adenylyltransferase